MLRQRWIESDEGSRQRRYKIVDAPIVEGALAGVVQGTISDDVADVIKASEDARNVHKN
ncbi:MAG: hypothetical protein ACLRYY_05615 [Anaerobutyricum soehngenii]